MRKVGLAMLMVLVLACFVLPAGEKVNVTGTWTLTMQSPRGERKVDYTFKQDGEKLVVSWIGREGAEMKADGTVTGNVIKWSLVRETPQGNVTTTYEGTVTGNTMTGKANAAGRSFDWTGVKK